MVTHSLTHATAAGLVPPAHGGEISDDILARIIGIAAKIEGDRADDLTEAEAALFTLTVRPLLEELQQHRRRMDVIADMADRRGNVVFLAPGAAQAGGRG